MESWLDLRTSDLPSKVIHHARHHIGNVLPSCGHYEKHKKGLSLLIYGFIGLRTKVYEDIFVLHANLHIQMDE